VIVYQSTSGAADHPKSQCGHRADDEDYRPPQSASCIPRWYADRLQHMVHGPGDPGQYRWVRTPGHLLPRCSLLCGWSPDGERLAFRDREGNAHVYDVALAETRRIEPGDIVDWIDDQTLLVSVE